jgi:hypothetical protein
MVPAIAFSIPDLDGTAQLQLFAKNGNAEIACLQSSVSNGKSLASPAVPYIAAGIAGSALIVSALSSLSAAPGSAAPSPSFVEVVGWFQSMALNGMLSVSYPPVYRSFSRNFAFSNLLIPWRNMQFSIDNFRQATGGNLTGSSVQFLENNATIVTDQSNSTVLKRSLVARAAANTTATSKIQVTVQGIAAFVEPLMIPKANTFMTVLLYVAILIGAIIAGILLFRLILGIWSLMGKLPRKLESFKDRYWWIMAKTITNLILCLYGIWVLYCLFQFFQGDSWAAKTLAGVTLALFTSVLVWFTWRIFSLARKYKMADGDASALYDNKETWRNYSLFYENYKKSYYWLFVPVIVYLFARGTIVAAGDGHGLVQTGGQLIVESLMLLLLLFLRPYSLKSGNWINITIQVVRVLSVLCILVFVEKIGISQTPKAITGVVLVAMQSALTGLLAILVAVNALVMWCRRNPHRKARKEAGTFPFLNLIPFANIRAEKTRADDTLTPLDARNSMLESWQKGGNGTHTAYVTAQPDAARRKLSDSSSVYTRAPSMRQPLLPHVSLPSQYHYRVD